MLRRSDVIDLGVSRSQDRKMRERAIRPGAVPMPRSRRHESHVSWLERMVIIVGGDKTAPRRGDQHLIRCMAVGPVDRPVRECHRRHAQKIRKFLVDDFLCGNRTDEDWVRRRHALRTVEADISNSPHTCTPFWFATKTVLAKGPLGKYAGLSQHHMSRNLLPEEDALDDPDDDGADPTVPGDLWLLNQWHAAMKTGVGGRGSEPVVYSRAFVPTPARNYGTWREIRIHMND
jgi:hypothetical protein